MQPNQSPPKSGSALRRRPGASYRVAAGSGEELVVKTLAAYRLLEAPRRSGDIGWRTEHCFSWPDERAMMALVPPRRPPMCGGCRIAYCCSGRRCVPACLFLVPLGQVIWGSLFTPDFSLPPIRADGAVRHLFARVLAHLEDRGSTTGLCALLGFPAALFLAGKRAASAGVAALRDRSIFPQYADPKLHVDGTAAALGWSTGFS